MPVNRLKLLAFMFGAADRGPDRARIVAAAADRRLPDDFDLALLITVYAMVILGGAGSLAGVVLGAIVINVVARGAARSRARALAVLRRS